MFVSVDDLVARTTALLDDWAAVDWRSCDPTAVAVGASFLLRAADRVRAISLLAVAEHDTRGGVGRDGDASIGDWTSRHTKASPEEGRRTAARARRVAKATKTAKAAADGRLSTDQADRIAAARTEENAEAFDAAEDDLITRAQASYEDAVKAAEEFRTATGETPEQRARRLWNRRSAACWDDSDGMTQGRQSLAGDAAADFRLTFEAFLEAEKRNRQPGDTRTYAQLRADAFAAMARAARDRLAEDAPGLAATATIQVGVRYEDIIDDDLAAWTGEILQTGQALTGDAVRRLCCDAGILRVVTRGDSLAIDVGRRTRTIPVATRRAVLERDGHRCTYPGCHHRDGIQVHHLRHWARLGATDLDNLATTCWHHHRLLHEGGWNLELDSDTQRTIWTSPDGRRLIGQRRATADAPPQRTTTAA